MRALQGHRAAGRQVSHQQSPPARLQIARQPSPLQPALHADRAFYNRFSNNYTSARFYKVDVDEVPEAAQEHSVRAMPTFLLFKDGGKVGEVVGANPAALEAAIKEHSA